MCYGQLLSDMAHKRAMMLACEECNRPLLPSVRHAMLEETVTTGMILKSTSTRKVKLHFECVDVWKAKQ